jgi:hypothetical protein
MSLVGRHENRNKIPIVPIAALSGVLGVSVVVRGADFNRGRDGMSGVSDGSERPKSDLSPVPVIDDQNEAFLQSWPRKHDTIIVIQLFVRSVKKENIETTERTVIHSSEVAFD